jgi:hypothetical protein
VVTLSSYDGDLAALGRILVDVTDDRGLRVCQRTFEASSPCGAVVLLGLSRREPGWVLEIVDQELIGGLDEVAAKFGVLVDGAGADEAQYPPDPDLSPGLADPSSTAEDSEVATRIRVPPHPGLIASLGANHTFATSLADLVDNSVDAGASTVCICLNTRVGRLDTLTVVDDGRGMSEVEADAAMTIGRRRDYAEGSLGHFGLGLKSASLAHSDRVTVYTRTEDGSAVGRRIVRSRFEKDFECDVLTADAADDGDTRRVSLLTAAVRGPGGPGRNLSASGTMVSWAQIRNVYQGVDPDEASEWLARLEADVRAHLGVVFHRLLNAKRLRILVRTGAEDSPWLPVEPVDPFGYRVSGHPGYPKDLDLVIGGRNTRLRAHIIPPDPATEVFRLGGRGGEKAQGLYVYRNDRLLQAGGWAELTNPRPSRQYARLVLDDAAAIGDFVTMNPEKRGLRLEPAFQTAVAHALSGDGTTFSGFLSTAEEVYGMSRRRQRRRKPAVHPGKGFAPGLRKTIAAELEALPDSANIQWRKLEGDDFFEVDHAGRTIWLNSRYRSLFVPGHGGLNDAPVIKGLVYLLMHEVLEGQRLGAKQRDDIELWRAVLGAAVEDQLRQADRT